MLFLSNFGIWAMKCFIFIYCLLYILYCVSCVASYTVCSVVCWVVLLCVVCCLGMFYLAPFSFFLFFCDMLRASLSFDIAWFPILDA